MSAVLQEDLPSIYNMTNKDKKLHNRNGKSS